MFKLLFSIISVLLLAYTLSAQWTQNPILDPFYQATVIPQWADLDNDGLDDMVNYDDINKVVFWSKNLNGSFGESAIIQTNIELKGQKFLIQDYDFDGDFDIIGELTKSSSRDYYWMLLRNDGNANFNSQEFYLESDTYNGDILTFEDLNGDGFRDLIIPRWQSIHFYLNNGDDTFTLVLQQGTQSYTPFYAKDMDMDGTAEVIKQLRNHDFEVYQLVDGSLNLLYTIKNTANEEWIPKYLKFIDFDLDGDLDILFAIQSGQIVINGDVGNVIYGNVECRAIKNGGDGQFQVFHPYFSQTQSNGPPYYAVGDLDGDGYPEWVLFDEKHTVLKLNSNFEYALHSTNEVYLPQGHNLELNIVPLKTDENASIISYRRTAFHYSSYHSIHPGSNALGSFNWSDCINCTPIIEINNADLNDIDGDNDLDIIIASIDNNYQIAWIENIDNGCDFEIHNVLLDPFDISNTSLLQIASGDLDNDGDADIVVKENTEVTNLYVLKNENGNFGEKIFLTSVEYGNDLYIEDIHDDGYPEIILRRGRYSGTYPFLETFKINIYNNTSGFDNLELQILETRNVFGEVEFGDIDSDGDIDLVAHHESPFSPMVEIYKNENGLLQSVGTTYDLAARTFSLDLFDVNKDGYPDILAQHRSPNIDECLFVYYNDNGFFNPENRENILCEDDEFKVNGLYTSDGETAFLINGSLFGGNPNIHLSDLNGNNIDLLDSRASLNIIGDLTGDGFGDLVIADFTSNLYLFSQDNLNCDYQEPTCLPDTNGHLYFDDCEGSEYFLIELEDGTILDPYFAETVVFNYFDGQDVKFNYQTLDAETPCTDALPVEISCIIDRNLVPEITDYNWVSNNINDINDCCEVSIITAFYNEINTFLYFSPKDDCDVTFGRLYDENGNLYCTDNQEHECYITYELQNYFQEVIWECGQEIISNNLDIDSETYINIYPNPASDLMYIDSNPMNFDLIDMHGRIISSYPKGTKTIETNQLLNGLYYLKFEAAEKMIIKKLVVHN